MISDEAVEAAKKVAFERYGSKPDSAYLRTILEAAASHMLAAAWDQGMSFAAGLLNAEELTPSFRKDNPYRSQT